MTTRNKKFADRAARGMGASDPEPAAADEARRQVENTAKRLKAGERKSKVSHAVTIAALILIVQEQQREIKQLRADVERREDAMSRSEDA